MAKFNLEISDEISPEEVGQALQNWFPVNNGRIIQVDRLPEDRNSPRNPNWTVFYNIVSPEGSTWVGTGWEFFETLEQAQEAFARLSAFGNCCCLRPYKEKSDREFLGAVHRV